MLLATCLGTFSVAQARSEQSATAPDDRPPPVDSRVAAGADRLGLDRVDFSLELSGEYEQRRVRTEQGPYSRRTRQTNSWGRLEEVGRLGLDGYLFDRDIFSFSGDIGLGLTQERSKERFDGWERTDSFDGTLAEFDVRADLFSGGAVSGNVFALQARDRYARPFLPSLRERRSEYGAAVYLNDDVLPMEWRFEHRDVDRDGSRRDFDNERVVQDYFAYRATWNHRPDHTLRLDFEYDDREERYSGGTYRFDTQRYQLRAEDTWTFGDGGRHRLDTVVRYQQEAGDVARDLFEAGPRLTLKHSDTLTTFYQYQYSREKLGQYDIDLHRFDAGLTHQLFTNLTTTVNLFGLKEDIKDDSETDEFGGNIDWAYTRENALGVFSGDLGLTHELEWTRGGATRVQLRESGTFRDPLPVVLARQGAWTPSILVWDSTRTRLFVRGRDYVVVQRRGATLLFRSLLGRIRNNQSVSIDYVYLEDRDARRGTTRVDARLQQAFNNGWTPYYAFESRWEDRDSSRGTPLRENDLHRHRLGVKYERPRWSAGGELELLRDNIDPFIAYRAYGDVALLRRPAGAIDARLDVSHFFFSRDADRDVILVEGTIDGRYDWSRRAGGFGRATYRYEDDRWRGIVHGVDVETGAELRWGPYTVVASVEYDLLNLAESHEDGFGVWLKVRREFEDVLAKR